MTKAEFITAVQQAATVPITKAHLGQLVDATFAALGNAIAHDKRMVVPGIGTFTVRQRKAHRGRNPRTQAPIRIKASKTVGFKPAPGLKQGL
jgi:DNA-binding protein HU-beta